MTDKPIAILPCPFCGEPPASAFVGDDDGGYWAIECAKCMKTGGGRFIGCHCDDETSAVAAWNTRTEAATIADPLKDSLDDRIRQLRVAAINYSNGDEKLAKRTVEWLAADEFSATIAELRERLREAEKLTEQLHAKMTCMCGSDINHSAWEGHSPVSMYDYALEAAEARATAAEHALVEARHDLNRIYAALPKRPRCHECADNDGTCPHSGTPCDPTDEVIAAVAAYTAGRK